MQELWARITRITQLEFTWCLLLNVPWRTRLLDGIIWITVGFRYFHFLVSFSGCVDVYIKGKQIKKKGIG